MAKNETYWDETHGYRDMKWERPKQNPVFVKDGMSLNDVTQGAVGDCWFLAALSAVAARPERLGYVVNPQTNETVKAEKGFNFRFYSMGFWKNYKGNNDICVLCVI